MVEPEPRGVRARQRRDTEQRILTAARRLFAEVGYERTTIRSVADAAGADPGLVMRYFGSKRELFARASHVPADELGAGTPDEIVDRVLASLAAKLTGEPTPTLAMLRSMLTHPDAGAQVRAGATDLEARLAAAIPAADAEVRAGLVGAITMGTLIARHLLGLNGLRTATPEQITALLQPILRDLVAPER